MQSVPYVIMFGGIALLLAVPLLTREPAVSPTLGSSSDGEGGSAARGPRVTRARAPRPRAMIAAISIAVLGAALYVLVIRDDDPLCGRPARSQPSWDTGSGLEPPADRGTHDGAGSDLEPASLCHTWLRN